jgi:hypothetical protein
MMIFEKAHKELMAGKKIRRKEWDPMMHLRMVGENIKAFRGEVTNFYNNPNFLQSKDWIVVDGDGTKLSFIEALEELKLKKSITNEVMQDEFIFVDNGNLVYCKPVEYDFMPTWKCMNATDWELMK